MHETHSSNNQKESMASGLVQAEPMEERKFGIIDAIKKLSPAKNRKTAANMFASAEGEEDEPSHLHNLELEILRLGQRVSQLEK